MMSRIRAIASSTIPWLERRMKTDVRYVLHAGFWINLNFVLVSILSLILSICFANFLSKHEYGIYQYILSVAALLTAFTHTGMHSAIMQSVARGYEGTFPAAVRPIFLWNLIPGAAAFVMSGYYFFQGNMALGIGIAAVGISLPILNTCGSYAAFLAGKKDFKTTSLYTMAGNVAYYGCMYLAIFFFPAALPLILVNLTVTSLAAFIAYRRIVTTRPIEGEVDEAAPRYGRHLTSMNMLNIIASQVDNFLVFHFLGATSLAAYSLATLVPERLGGAFKAITLASMPRFAERELALVQRSMGRKVTTVLVATLICTVMYTLLAPALFRLIYPAYLDVITYSQWYSLTLVVIAANLVTSALYAHKRVRELYVINVAVPIIQIGVQVVAVILGGLAGMIAGKIIAAIIAVAVSLVLLRRSAQA